MLPNYYGGKNQVGKVFTLNRMVMNFGEREFKAERTGRYLESRMCLVYSRKIKNSKEDGQR